MATKSDEEIRSAVREHYAEAARAVDASCCGTSDGLIGRTLYQEGEAQSLPESALAVALGCGNPTLLADLHPGEVVLDLGSGGGIDVLLSARRVSPGGKAYGLDMTPEMLELARRNQKEAGVENAEFLEGTMEAVPLPDESVDVIISNCVVNLSPDKPAVFAEAFRVLRPGGRLAISDIVLLRKLPAAVEKVVGLWTGCVAGALLDDEYKTCLERAGFVGIDIESTHVYDQEDITRMTGDIAQTVEIPETLDIDATIAEIGGSVMSGFVRARKPNR